MSSHSDLSARSPVQHAAFRYQVDHWTIDYAGRVCRFKDSKGLRYLAILLSHQGVRFSALRLVAQANETETTPLEGKIDPAAVERARLNVMRAVATAMRRIKTHHPELWTHLNHTVRVGLQCAYTPDTQLPIKWEV
jgi:hypothetical protein